MDTKELLLSKKMRVTDFRLAVLEVFTRHQNAISTANIEESLGDFDRITLYRTMKSFKEKGIIHEIQMGEDLKKYALCEDSCEDHSHHHNHVHFHCEKCNELFCLPLSKNPELDLGGFTVNDVEIQATGICAFCV